MNPPRDPEAIVAAWLEEGPDLLPEATRRAIAVGTRTTTQRRRGLAVHWRSFRMQPITRLGLAFVLALAFGGAILVLNTPRSASGPGGASSTPRSDTPSQPSGTSPAPTSGPVASPVSFTSSRYRYTVRYPSDYLAEAALTDWSLGEQALPNSTFLDRFSYAGPFSGPSLFVGIASQAIPAGTDAAAWIAARQTREASALMAGCTGSSGWQPTEVAGATASRFDAVCGTDPGSEIVFVAGDRGWIVTGDRAAIDAVVPSLTLP